MKRTDINQPKEENFQFQQNIIGCTTKLALFVSKSGSVYSLDMQNLERLQKPQIQLMGHRIVQISCGRLFFAGLDIYGIVCTFGKPVQGYRKFDLVPIHLRDKIKQHNKLPFISFITCGEEHICCLHKTDTNYKIFGMGSNTKHQLRRISGSHNEMKSILPYEESERNVISYNSDIINKKIQSIDCGGAFTMLLCTDGSIWGTGDNEFGQLGFSSGCTDFMEIKVELDENEKIIAVSCGNSHALILTNKGNVYSTGNNQFGQLGLGPKLSRKSNFTKISTLSNITQISCQYDHSICLDKDNKIWSFGRNNYYQIDSNEATRQQNFYEPKLQYSHSEPILSISNGFGYCTITQTDSSIYISNINYLEGENTKFSEENYKLCSNPSKVYFCEELQKIYRNNYVCNQLLKIS